MKTLIAFVGRAHSGRKTIANYLEQNKGFHKIVMCTTRTPREWEVDGEDYYFKTEKEFLSMLESGELFGCATDSSDDEVVLYGYLSKEFNNNDNLTTVTNGECIKYMKEHFKGNLIVVNILADTYTRLKRAEQKGEYFEETWELQERCGSKDMNAILNYIDYTVFNNIDDELEFKVDCLIESIKNRNFTRYVALEDKCYARR